MKNNVISLVLIAVLVVAGVVAMLFGRLYSCLLNVRTDAKRNVVLGDVDGVCFRPRFFRSLRENESNNIREMCHELNAVEQSLRDLEKEGTFFLDVDIDTAKLANMVNIEPFLLLRYFDSKETAFSKYVGDLRSRYARQYMVDNPDATLSDVAAASGFRSLSTFRDAFRDWCGLTPENFRFQYVGVSELEKHRMAAEMVLTNGDLQLV